MVSPRMWRNIPNHLYIADKGDVENSMGFSNGLGKEAPQSMERRGHATCTQASTLLMAASLAGNISDNKTTTKLFLAADNCFCKRSFNNITDFIIMHILIIAGNQQTCVTIAFLSSLITLKISLYHLLNILNLSKTRCKLWYIIILGHFPSTSASKINKKIISNEFYLASNNCHV
ncbi:hypothetical protein E2C01_021181 [Portunus trituberculatus]|uniref:Uncharacterized protein n=1 Tax=Portunus trituberculatus TaxID=210409 RepID=A0A5B7E2J7_PORTR|nr:hypothetical protein [Portunus trituberculatus]